MFTGLIEQVGTIDDVNETEAGREIAISSEFESLGDGESIAVNGTCLTVLDSDAGRFKVAAVTTTLGRTTIGEWRRGQRVNLERALRAEGRLGGHIVQGHVDGVATVKSIERSDDALLIDLDLPRGLSDTLVPLGSVAVDGVSLTVNALTGNRLQVSLIEYTLKHSALGDLKKGSRVNIETDIIGKYIKRLAIPYTGV
jgi:riboflavin synthase